MSYFKFKINEEFRLMLAVDLIYLCLMFDMSYVFGNIYYFKISIYKEIKDNLKNFEIIYCLK